MLRTESFSSSFASLTDGWSYAPLTAPARMGEFTSLYHDVRNEIIDFIEHGSGQIGAMSDEGYVRLLPSLYTAYTAPSLGAAHSPEQRAFLKSIAPWVQGAAKRLGVAAEIIAAQAALESGWGQRTLRREDGAETHNLFGLKAGGGWSGDVALATTTEYVDGVALRKVERFRSYPNLASAIDDFTRLLLNSPRYRSALNTGSDARAYALGLVRGGYATDPSYADKLVQIASRLQYGD